MIIGLSVELPKLIEWFELLIFESKITFKHRTGWKSLATPLGFKAPFVSYNLRENKVTKSILGRSIDTYLHYLEATDKPKKRIAVLNCIDRFTVVFTVIKYIKWNGCCYLHEQLDTDMSGKTRSTLCPTSVSSNSIVRDNILSGTQLGSGMIGVKRFIIDCIIAWFVFRMYYRK